MDVLAKNLKQLRVSKNMTQEQAAEALGISAQTVSRWECGTTLPDAALLPQIARLYCVTVDDLYSQASVAYENYAQRLFSIYEASRKPEDFLRADLEFQRLIKSGKHTDQDLRSHGILYQYMMGYCMEKAQTLFRQVLEKGPSQDPDTYWSTRRQQACFLHQIGRNNETIREFLPLVIGGSTELNHWICLIQAYQLAEEYQTAWEWAQKAQAHFPENAMLHIYCGDLCESLEAYDDAFVHWKRALELEPRWLDAAYSMGACYEKLGNYEKAYEVWCRIAQDLAQWGYEAEVYYPRSLASRCKEKLQA